MLGPRRCSYIADLSFFFKALPTEDWRIDNAMPNVYPKPITGRRREDSGHMTVVARGSATKEPSAMAGRIIDYGHPDRTVG